MSQQVQAKFIVPISIIKHEYQYHKDDGQFDSLENFRQYIVQQTYTCLENIPANRLRTTINYNNLYRNNSRVCGIFEKNKLKSLWTLTKFVTQSQITKNKKRNKNKQSKKRTKVKSYFSYDPKQYEKSTTQITKKMTQTIIPKQVNETDINDMYHYILKSIALSEIVTANDGKTRVFNVNFTDKNTGKSLYCIAQISDKHSYQWILQNQLYTAEDILKLTNLNENELPTSVRDTYEFRQQLNYIVKMEKMLNNPEIRAKVFNTKVTWQNIPVFTNEKDANKTELKLTKPKDIFVNDCKIIFKNKHISLVPILLFDHHPGKANYTIHGLMRLKMEGNDIGISFKYKNDMILPSAIHLQGSYVKLMHQLAVPNACQNEIFDDWKTEINGMFIGDRDYHLNQFKSKSIDCQKRTDVLMSIVTVFDELNINITDARLAKAMKKAKALLPSLHNENNDSNFNDEVKYNAASGGNIYGTVVFYPNMGSHIETPLITSGMIVPVPEAAIQPIYNEMETYNQSSALNVNAAEYVPETNKLSTIKEVEEDNV